MRISFPKAVALVVVLVLVFALSAYIMVRVTSDLSSSRKPTPVAAVAMSAENATLDLPDAPAGNISYSCLVTISDLGVEALVVNSSYLFVVTNGSNLYGATDLSTSAFLEAGQNASAELSTDFPIEQAVTSIEYKSPQDNVSITAPSVSRWISYIGGVNVSNVGDASLSVVGSSINGYQYEFVHNGESLHATVTLEGQNPNGYTPASEYIIIDSIVETSGFQTLGSPLKTPYVVDCTNQIFPQFTLNLGYIAPSSSYDGAIALVINASWSNAP